VAEPAISHTVRPEGEDALADAVWRLRSRGCWTEAAALLTPLVPRQPDAALRQAALYIECCGYTGEGWDRAEEALRTAEALPLSDEERGLAACERGQLAYAATQQGVRDRTDEARSALGRAAALLRPAGPARPLLDYRRGLMAQYLSDSPQDAEAAYRRAHAEVAGRRDRESRLLHAAVLLQLGTLELLGGELTEARALFTQCLRLREETGYLVGIAPALTALAEAVPAPQAARLRGEAARLSQLLGNGPGAPRAPGDG
jgi:tetratricopeptide (TPR) repeat protein